MPQERQEKRIDELDILAGLDGTEQLPLSKDGAAHRISVNLLLANASQAITVSQDSDGFYVNHIVPGGIPAGGGGSVTVDDALSATSENPVQNKVIKVALDGKISLPSNPTSGQFLVYNGTAWVAQTLSEWQGGSY